MLHWLAMPSRLCQRHFTGNGYGFDGPWRQDAQRREATREALSICYAWIDGQESRAEFQDAVLGLVEMYGAGVKAGCRILWAASLERVSADEDMRLAYFDQGMELVTRHFRRHPGLFRIATGWEHHNHQNAAL